MHVWVTGSGRGIGKAIATLFSEKKACVTLNAKSNKDELLKTQTQLQKSNPHVFSVLADISDYEQAQKAHQTAVSYFGNVDVLINNAGISHVGLFSDMKPCQWQNLVQTNINAMLNATHLVLPAMQKQKRGVIVNISSVWGETGASCEVVYSATKGAVNQFTKSLAKELGPVGIRVNAVSCGVIETQMNDFLDEQECAQLMENIPLGRFGKPSEVADLVYFLASKKAAYMTGQIVTLDGGFCS